MTHDVHSVTFSVRYDECGPRGDARASVYMRLFQELAFAHSAALGFPLAWYEHHRFFWLLRRVNLVVLAPARYGDALFCTTRVAGARRVMARRINTAYRADGTLIAAAMADWIFTEGGVTPSRISQELRDAFPTLQRPVAPIPLEEVDPEEVRPTAGSPRNSLRIRLSDADALGHANNAVYFDLLDDAVARSGGAATVDAHPRTYDLQYNSAAPAGAAVSERAWSDGRGWHYRLESDAGALHVHGRVIAELAPIGETQDVLR